MCMKDIRIVLLKEAKQRDFVEFLYKNGDKGSQYFSLVYNTLSYSHHFYPDYIVKLKNGDVLLLKLRVEKL